MLLLLLVAFVGGCGDPASESGGSGSGPAASPAGSARIRAKLRPATVARGGKVIVRVMISNPGRSTLSAANPVESAGACTLRVHMPDGEEWALPGAPTQAGVPPRLVNSLLPPGATETYELELSPPLQLEVRGRYAVVVEYARTPGEVWRSPRLALTVR